MKQERIKRLRGRPRILASGDETETIHVRLRGELLTMLNREWRKRGLPTRVEAVRTLLHEALTR